MKKLWFTLFIISILCINSFAQPKIKWVSIVEAMQLSSKEPKKIIVDVYTDWCGYCKVMDQQTFSDTNIAKYINENFYAVKLNAEQKESIVLGTDTFNYIPTNRRGYHELAALLLNGKLSYPSIVFINESAQIIQAVPGFKQPRQFDYIINFIGNNHYLKTDFSEFSKTYQSNIPEKK